MIILNRRYNAEEMFSGSALFRLLRDTDVEKGR